MHVVAAAAAGDPVAVRLLRGAGAAGRAGGRLLLDVLNPETVVVTEVGVMYREDCLAALRDGVGERTRGLRLAEQLSRTPCSPWRAGRWHWTCSTAIRWPSADVHLSGINSETPNVDRPRTTGQEHPSHEPSHFLLLTPRRAGSAPFSPPSTGEFPPPVISLCRALPHPVVPCRALHSPCRAFRLRLPLRCSAAAVTLSPFPWGSSHACFPYVRCRPAPLPRLPARRRRRGRRAQRLRRRAVPPPAARASRPPRSPTRCPPARA